jgi:hypothetical protein
MNLHSKDCPKCGTPLEPPGDSGGRPRRWCSPGCQRSGEAEMRRINSLLKHLELNKSRLQCHGPALGIERIDEVIAEWQRKYDQLAGVAVRKEK